MKHFKMIRNVFVVLSILLITVPAFGVVSDEETYVPEGLRNNHYFLESLRLNRLAMETFEFGDYDTSAGFAQEAIRFAELSDEYVSVQLIAETRRLLAWADSNNLAIRFPNEYAEGNTYYEYSVIAHDEEDWAGSISSATRAIGILSRMEVEVTGVEVVDRRIPLPAQFTVRTWTGERDALWNIAAIPGVFGDPWQWRRLFEANSSRMPEPNNPDLIHPGFVLDIPSIRGEIRQGMWDPNVTYEW